MNHTCGSRPSTGVFSRMECFTISTRLLELGAVIKLAQTVLVVPQKEFVMMLNVSAFMPSDSAGALWAGQSPCSLLSSSWVLSDSISCRVPIGLFVSVPQTKLLLYTRKTFKENVVNFLNRVLWWTGLIVVLAQRETNRIMEENVVQKETLTCMVTWLMTKVKREWALQ